MSIIIGETEYDSKLIESLRKVLIELRNVLLENNQFDLAIPLSHTIALLHHMIEEEKKKENHDE